MQAAIIEKLKRHLAAGIAREADVVYLFIEAGKYLEQDGGDTYPLLRFYRNWVAHSRINRLALAGDIPDELNKAVAFFLLTGDSERAGAGISKAISMHRLREELRGFLATAGLETVLMDNHESGRVFLKLLIGVLADVPLIISGYELLKRFSFTEVEKDSEPAKPIVLWVIESSEGVFTGPVLVS